MHMPDAVAYAMLISHMHMRIHIPTPMRMPTPIALAAMLDAARTAAGSPASRLAICPCRTCGARAAASTHVYADERAHVHPLKLLN